MGIELLILFITITILFFILSVIFMDSNPFIAMVYIITGIIFSIICTYGFFNIEYFYSDGATGYMYAVDIGETYAYVFFGLVFMFILILFRVVYNVLNMALETKGEIDYKKR